ncbi:MAG: HAD family hydrolase [Treponemataceae bacterium]|nr:HAD family hydrolase [Treponemataceae bacterium]
MQKSGTSGQNIDASGQKAGLSGQNTDASGQKAGLSGQKSGTEGKISALIFDIDNTLYTNDQYLAHQIDVQVQRFADLEGISFSQAEKRIEDAREAFAVTHGGAKTSFALVMQGFGYSVEKSIEWRKELIQPERFLKKDEKLHHLLEKLSATYKIISVTNNPADIGWRNLKAIGIDDFFLDIVGLDTCRKSKPAEEPFLKALEILGLPAEECVSIGDRYDIDIATPLRLGMKGILVSNSRDLEGLELL